jgi:glycosyltransferase involved in cell wall biosynthesis
MSKLKILVVHEVNYLSKVIFEMHEFPELLSVAGHEVHFLEFPEGTGYRNVSLKSKSRWITGRVHSSARIRLITPFTLGGSFFDRLLAPITVLPTLWKLFSKENYDVVLLYSVPTSGWQTVKIAKHFKTPVVYRALDVSHLIRKGLTSRLVLMAEKYVYKNATVISANNPELGNYVQAVGTRPDASLINLPPIEFSHFAHPVGDGMRRTLNLDKESFVIAYMGSLFEFSGLKYVIESLQEIDNEDVYLLIIGGGIAESTLKEQVDKLGLNQKVIFTGIVSYDDLPAYLSAADVLINPFEKIEVTNLALPHKVIQYLATGIPTVSTKLHGIHAVLKNDSGVFWAESPSDVFAVAKSTRSISRELKHNHVSAGIDFINSNFIQSIALDKLEHTLRAAMKVQHESN